MATTTFGKDDRAAAEKAELACVHLAVHGANAPDCRHRGYQLTAMLPGPLTDELVRVWEEFVDKARQSAKAEPAKAPAAGE